MNKVGKLNRGVSILFCSSSQLRLVLNKLLRGERDTTCGAVLVDCARKASRGLQEQVKHHPCLVSQQAFLIIKLAGAWTLPHLQVPPRQT